MNLLGSFVIPTYNCAAWLPHAVSSCQKQDYANIEIVVVDDGSTDSTQKVMEFMAKNDTRIKYHRLPKNMGRSYARNYGNKMATGDFIMVLDADDLAYPNRARLTAAAMKKYDFINGSCDYIDAIGNIFLKHIVDVFSLEKALKSKLNSMAHCTCAYRKEIAEKFQYNEGEPSRLGLDDWDFQLRVAASGAKFGIVPQVISAYRELSTGVSKTRNQDEVDAYKKAFLEALEVTA